MRFSAEKWAIAVCASLPILLLSGFLGTKVDGGPPFWAAAGFCILLLCSFSEWLIRPRPRPSFAFTVLAGAARGSLIGAGGWFILMMIVAGFEDTGDKFALFVVFFTPFAVGLGAIGGGAVRVISCRLRQHRV